MLLGQLLLSSADLLRSLLLLAVLLLGGFLLLLVSFLGRLQIVLALFFSIVLVILARLLKETEEEGQHRDRQGKAEVLSRRIGLLRDREDTVCQRIGDLDGS